MKHSLALLTFIAGTTLFAQTTTDKPILGFTPANAAKEHALEAQLDAKLNRDELRAWMQRLSARPHHLGSDYDRDNAEYIASLYRSFGYDTHIEEFQVLFPTPKKRVVELIAPERFTAKLFEPPIKEDATSGQTSEQLPVYNAYSIDGDVTSDLVYVNYGVPADYEELDRRGVDVKGKIVIARYTADRGAASNPRLPPSTARSAASSTPIHATTATSRLQTPSASIAKMPK